MKINKPKLQSAYLAKINQICELCEDKTEFRAEEIVSIITGLLETGEFILPPKKSSVLEICATRKELSPQWDKETADFVDELYSRLEYAETEVEVFNLRAKKQWTSDSNLYNQNELDHECLLSYNAGLSDGLHQAASSHDIGFRPQD